MFSNSHAPAWRGASASISAGRDETRYLDILQDRLARGTTPAQELLEKFNGPWAGSVDPIYDEEAY